MPRMPLRHLRPEYRVRWCPFQFLGLCVASSFSNVSAVAALDDSAVDDQRTENSCHDFQQTTYLGTFMSPIIYAEAEASAVCLKFSPFRDGRGTAKSRM